MTNPVQPTVVPAHPRPPQRSLTGMLLRRARRRALVGVPVVAAAALVSWWHGHHDAAAVTAAPTRVVAPAVQPPAAQPADDVTPASGAGLGVVLPATVAGQPLLNRTDHAHPSATGPVGLPDDLHGAAFDVGAYMDPAGDHALGLRVVVARTDLSGTSAVSDTAAPYSHHGDVTCTQTFRTPSGVRHEPDAATCWRTTPRLGVAVQAAVLDGHPVGELAAAVDRVWAAQPAG